MRRIAAIFACLFIIGIPALAQQFDSTPGSQTGIAPYGSYFNAQIDKINLYNGNLLLDIPLFTLPGREISTGLRLTYNAQKWEESDAFFWRQSHYTGGWRIYDSMGSSPLYANSNGEWVGCLNGDNDFQYLVGWLDGLGTKRFFTADLFTTGCDDTQTPPSPSNVFAYSDGDENFFFPGTSASDEYIKLNDGTIINGFGDGQNPTATTKNGNYISRGSSGFPLTDTLGRSMTITHTGCAPGATHCDNYTITDANGVQRTYRLNWQDGISVLNPYSQTWETQTQLLSIVLPNGRNYAFIYGHEQGYLTRVTLPTGGFITYNYPSDQTALGNDYVVNRNVSYDGQNTQTWMYQRNDIDALDRNVTVTSPGNNVAVHKFNAFTDPSNDELLGREIETDWLQNSVTLQTQTNQWNTDGTPLVMKTARGGMQRQTTMTFDNIGEILQQREYDWGPGAPGILLSETDNTYNTFPDTGTSVSLRTSMETKGINPQDGQFERQGYIQYGYDETPLAPTPGNVPNKGTPLQKRRNVTTITRQVNAGGQTVSETTQYDDLGNPIAHTDANNLTTNISYADNFTVSAPNPTYAFPTTVTNALSQQTRTQYDYDTGLATKTTDARNLNTVFGYELMGRIASITTPNSQVTSYAYDDVTPEVTEQDQLDYGSYLTTGTFFDKFYRPTRTVQQDPAGSRIQDTVYDVDGRVAQVSEPYTYSASAWTTTTYDALNRPLVVTNPDGSQRQTIYPSYAGNMTEVFDEAGNYQYLTYNGLGQLTQVQDGVSTTTYKNYVFGALAAVNQSGQQRWFTYDWLGNLLNETHPESGTTSYSYDNGSRLTSRSDARGIGTYYSYDSLNRLTMTSYGGGNPATPSVTRRYDESGYAGLLTSVVDGLGTTTYAYDLADEVNVAQRGITGVGTFTSSYGYDLGGRLKQIYYPSGRLVTRTYPQNAATRLSTLTDGMTNTTILSSVQDNAAGLVTARTIGGIYNEYRGFDTRYQISSVSAVYAGSTTLMSMAYGYTLNGIPNNGRIRTRNDNIQPEHSAQYTYDLVNRLSAATNPLSSWSISWGFDAFGNRTSQVPSGTATARVGTMYSGYNGNRNTAFFYDLAGNVTGDGLHNYTYDAENRMITVDGGAVQFAYDGEGQRVMKTSSGVTTYYIYGLTGLMSEFSTTPGAASAASTDRLQYRIGEPNGTAVLSLSPSGTVLENNRVLPYGEMWNTFVASSDDQKFTSYDRDSWSGTDYAMARFYSNASGRFLSPDPGHAGADPTNPQSWNVYSYGLNDPINNTDPDGLECVDGINPETGNMCVDVNGTVPGDGTIIPPGACTVLDGIFLGCDGGGGTRPSTQVVQTASEITKQIVNFVTAPRDPGCMSAAGGGGMAAGLTGGAAVGLVGGPFAEITVPSASFGGAILGGIGGYGYGLIKCMSSSGAPGGSGGNRQKTRGANRADAKQIRDAAREIGVDPRKFGDYIEEVKGEAGRGPSQNFSFRELLELAKEFKAIHGGN